MWFDLRLMLMDAIVETRLWSEPKAENRKRNTVTANLPSDEE
jgi:hypothetical protein